MSDDLWVLEVLCDIGHFADERGLYRLRKAMEISTEEFLEDIREKHCGGAARLSVKKKKPTERDVVVVFPGKI